MKLDFKHERLLTPRKNPFLLHCITTDVSNDDISIEEKKLVDDLCYFYITCSTFFS